jgi:hypothetical protein
VEKPAQKASPADAPIKKVESEKPVEQKAGEKKGPIQDTATKKVEEKPVSSEKAAEKSGSPEPVKVASKEGCMSEIEAQNIEVVTCNEILSSDSDVSLRATTANARTVIDDLKERLKNCDKKFSRGYISNAIRRIENAIKNAEEATIGKRALARLNTVTQKKNYLLQKFDMERMLGRPDFNKLQAIFNNYESLCGSGEPSDSALQVLKQMEKSIRRKGISVGEDVTGKLEGHIRKKEVSDAEKEFNYILANSAYIRVLDLIISSLEIDHYAREIAKIGGTVSANSEKTGPGEPEPEETVEIRTDISTKLPSRSQSICTHTG